MIRNKPNNHHNIHHVILIMLLRSKVIVNGPIKVKILLYNIDVECISLLTKYDCCCAVGWVGYVFLYLCFILSKIPGN